MIRKIHLIRHGRTIGNDNRWYYGATELMLTDEGKEEILKFKEEGVYPKITDNVFTSGMSRCGETLRLIYGDTDSVDIPELREMEFGIFECHSHDELSGNPEYDEWCSDNTGDYAMTGGESRNHYHERVRMGLDRLLDTEGDVTCICHGGTIAWIMRVCFDGDEEENIFKWSIEPGRGYTLIADGKEAIGYEKM